MVSNDVNEAPCEALLLTPKARLIAPLVVWRRGDDDFLLLTEPELGEVVAAHLTRMRLRAQVEVEREEHTSHVVFGGGDGRVRRRSTASRPSRCSTPTSSRRSERTSSSCCGFALGRRAGVASSTSACFPPRQGSRSGRSRSRRAAIRGRSRLPASTTAGTQTVGCGCSRSRAPSCPPTTRSCSPATRSSGG